MANKDVSPASYLKFREFLEKQCGIVLGDNKQYLVRSRLASLLFKYKYESADELIDVVVRGFDRSLLQSVIDAMTTNETLWFRDNYPFDLLVKDLFPKLSAKNQKIRIWSAASVLEYQRQRPGALRAGVEIVATDLSSEMLQKCESGIYDELSLARGLSPQRRQAFFQKNESGLMQIKPDVRRMVNFRSLNLLSSYAALGRFDIVFCRNVLIYFSADIKQRILQQIAGQLQSEGILFLGASESISAASDTYNMVKCHPGLYYQKK